MRRTDAIRSSARRARALCVLVMAGTAALTVMAAAGCDSGNTKAATGDGGGADGGGDAGGSPSTGPTWTRVYNEVIVANSCDSAFCHAGAAAGGLSLSPTPDDAYDALVGKASTNDPCKGMKRIRVIKGKPDTSLMYAKLAALSTSCGMNMPPKPFDPATKAQIKLVHDWIAAGAKKD